jgi:hypothetical protein
MKHIGVLPFDNEGVGCQLCEILYNLIKKCLVCLSVANTITEYCQQHHIPSGQLPLLVLNVFGFNEQGMQS